MTIIDEYFAPTHNRVKRRGKRYMIDKIYRLRILLGKDHKSYFITDYGADMFAKILMILYREYWASLRRV